VKKWIITKGKWGEETRGNQIRSKAGTQINLEVGHRTKADAGTETRGEKNLGEGAPISTGDLMMWATLIVQLPDTVKVAGKGSRRRSNQSFLRK